MSRKTWSLPSTGHVTQLTMENEKLKELETGFVRVQIKAIGLNFADVFQVLGFYSATPKGKFIPGLEFSGEVLESCSEKWNVGDRVMGVTRFGAYVTIIDADSNYLLPLPANWSFEQGCSYVVQGLTAWFGLDTLAKLREHPSSSILIHSAAGGVGYLCLRILEQFPDTRVVGTVGGTSKISWLESQFSEMISRGQLKIVQRRPGTLKPDTPSLFEQDCVQALESMSRKGFDIIMDAVSGEYFYPGLKMLQPMGKLVLFGSASLTPSPDLDFHRGLFNPFQWPGLARFVYNYWQRPKLDPSSLVTQNKSVMGFNLIWLFYEHEFLFSLLDQLNDLLKVSPTSAPENVVFVGKEFEFDNLPEAITFLQTGKNLGKVVVRIQ